MNRSGRRLKLNKESFCLEIVKMAQRKDVRREKEKKFSNLLMLTGERKHKAEINSKVPDKKVDGKN